MPHLSRVGLRNLAIVFPEKARTEHLAILKRSFASLAGAVLDCSRFPRMNQDWVDANCDVKDVREVIAKARARAGGKGILIGATHFSSFELLFQAYAFVDRPVSVLARGFGLPHLDRWWTAQRESHGHRVFPRKGGHREIVARLNAGEDVAILFDQNVKRKHATFADFFGTPAATTKAMGLVALQTGCPIVFVACAEVSPGSYKFFAEEIPNPKLDLGTAKQKVSEITESLHRALEQMIRSFPEQWFWIHRRFKTRPLGEPETVYSG